MNGYELAALLRTKVTITTAMQAADKLEELEDKLKKKTGKKNESKPGGNQDSEFFYGSELTIDNNGVKEVSS